MILKDLFELNIENKEKYHFCIFIDGNFNVISTNNKMTYDELLNIVGYQLVVWK